MLVIREFRGLEAVNRFLQGGIEGGTDLRNAFIGNLFLHNKTLIFSSPASETVTFNAGGDQVPITLPDIKTQIEAQTTGVVAEFYEGRLVLVEATPASGVAVTKDGTANAQLGFSTVEAAAGTVFNGPAGAAPKFISVGTGSNESIYLLAVETA